MPPEPAPSPEELRDRIDAKATAKPEESADPRTQREYTFPFSYESGAKVYRGTFKNRILRVKERMLAGQLAADLAGGRPFSHLPPAAQQLVMAVSWMTYSLDREKRPEWARDLSEIDDEAVLLALYLEVWAHQATFLGRADNPESPPETAR